MDYFVNTQWRRCKIKVKCLMSRLCSCWGVFLVFVLFVLKTMCPVHSWSSRCSCWRLTRDFPSRRNIVTRPSLKPRSLHAQLDPWRPPLVSSPSRTNFVWARIGLLKNLFKIFLSCSINTFYIAIWELVRHHCHPTVAVLEAIFADLVIEVCWFQGGTQW